MMSTKVLFNDDGSMKLDLGNDGNYVMTKWYKRSLAIFRENSFKKYLNELDTKYSDNGNGHSVIRYFLSAAVTMMYKDGDGWSIPQPLKDYAVSDGEDLYMDVCKDEFKFDRDLPVVLLASQSNIEEAIRMTEEKHKG